MHRASEPHTRRRWAGPVRTVILEHPDHGHVCIFDIDKRGRMRDHATYTFDSANQSHSYFAHTPDAAAELARQAPAATAAALAALPNVQQLT